MSIGEHVVTAYSAATDATWLSMGLFNSEFATGLAGWKQSTGVWTAPGGGVLSVPIDNDGGGVNLWPMLIMDAAAGHVPTRRMPDVYRVSTRVTITGQPVRVFLSYGTGSTPAAAAGTITGQQTSLLTAGTWDLAFTVDAANDPDVRRYIAPAVSVQQSNVGSADHSVAVFDYLRLDIRDAPGVDLSCLVDEISIHYGRDEPNQQPEANAATITLDLADTVLPEVVDVGSTVIVATELAGSHIERFVGRVTDVDLGWDDEGENTPNAGMGQIIAVSTLADLGRRVVGDTPWATVELDGARIRRILLTAGVRLDDIRSDPGTVNILPRDVDSTAALDVASEVAASASGVLWETKSADIRYADAEHRRNLPVALSLDTCQILVTPTWKRSLAGLINKVSVGYGVTPEGGEQPRYLAQSDTSIAQWGTFDYTTTTVLAAAADAAAMAGLLLARNSRPVWLMTNLPVDVKSLSDAETMTLLGLEMHDLLELTGLPTIIGNQTLDHTALWVEGWTERLAWGEHEIELAVSGYCRTVPAPRWDDVLPAVTWDNYGTGSWDDAACTGPPISTGRWTDVPASQRWDTVPPATTWNTYT